jgi:hypothetical protein
MVHWVALDPFAVPIIREELCSAMISAGAHLILDVPLRTAILVGPALALSSTALGTRSSFSVTNPPIVDAAIFGFQ